MKETTFIFVYGTLMKGYGNHEHFLKDNYLWGDKATAKGQMYTLGGCPACDFFNETDSIVHGELYLIHPQIFPLVIKGMDRLEGYSENDTYNLYERILIDVKYEDEEIKAWTYSMNMKKRNHWDVAIVPSGNWREHGCNYWELLYNQNR